MESTLSDKHLAFNFIATGVGSVPFHDVDATCRDILRTLPQVPFWPQLVKRSYLEDMVVQCEEGLPLLDRDEHRRALIVSNIKDRASELTSFYNRFLSQDLDYFAFTRSHAPGLYRLMELIIDESSSPGPFIKGQMSGPLTFAGSVSNPEGQALLYDPELLEATTQGLAIKALWQVRQLEKTGKQPIIFLDEPYLSGFGSAFTPIQRDEVIHCLQTVINYLRDNTHVLIGIHCCGNTDWAMLLESGPDIINFDGAEYLDYFLLYAEDIRRFIDAGGAVAWGMVPTAGFTGEETVEGLFSKLEQGLDRIQREGVARDRLAERSLLTPSCGMGTMSPEAANSALDLLVRLSARCRAMSW